MYLPGIRITTFAMHRDDIIVPVPSGLLNRACIIVPRKAFLSL
jgi:hypothetical protein